MVGHQERPSTGVQYHFITIQSSENRKARKLARSHAVSRGLENKRKAQLKLGQNFHITSSMSKFERLESRNQPDLTLVKEPCIPIPASPGFFYWLAAASPRLHELLYQGKTRSATEPVLSVSDELVLHNFFPILRTEPDDHALLSAIMLTFSFATAAGHFNEECLEYQRVALSSVRERIGSPSKATMESTLGTILLLAGVEARQRVPHQVQLHMGAIYQLLEVCQRQRVYLSDGIKRAIFWSDLNATVMAGSTRVVDHTTFSELQWKRDPFSPDFFTLPPGFQAHIHVLSKEFIEILQDITALQCIRDSALFGKEDVISMAHIDNHQASIQSRLVGLSNCSPISVCCQIAAYLCSTMLRCKIWRTSTIPSHLSLQLLCKLQATSNDLIWIDSSELLIWLLHIGGAFAPTGSIRTAYKELLRSNTSTRFGHLYSSWGELLLILQQFVWSEKAFMSQVNAFWEECHV